MRTIEEGERMKKALTPMKAIRAKCLECSAGSSTEVKNCPVTACALYIYRRGKRPTEEDLAAAAAESGTE